MTTTDAFTIEVCGEAAGIVVREGRRFIFFAANPTYQDLERQAFRRIDEAERAARRLAKK